ncbi:hypothetical protein COU20_01975 [Candidatus Kaiserbacteria bacterium CG10_big_fil_rev_8_21_14_0_10_59_10]|uniref:GerMN domain-containing protein n=1 Tax=Candidatus Kaiserbacteria bacterium CG10_big_fil_rev_8_21_14_0_10_59_10 TaxID=1974612 RepID=A0A2H0UA21_9BACT|nr:MAG: hypothetical protein COU20_01975 [Candidatus Kaiserbacteria bacterium CG10_big_fil_rev_8_21_14_0_10_59_10]
MDTTGRNILIAVFIVLLIGLVVWAAWTRNGESTNGARTPPIGTIPPPATPPPPPPAATASVRIALLDTEHVTTGPERGCDRLVMATYTVSTTTMHLTAALGTLFGLEEEEIGSWHNFIARTNDTLSFDRALVEDGTAHIYLSGSLSGLAGVCDGPRARIQIEETALQFPTVQTVQLYLNEQPTTLTPDQSGS